MSTHSPVVRAFRALGALGPIDAKSVRRDPLLRWLIFYPALIALVARWAVPVLTSRVAERFEFDLVPYYPLVVSWLLLMTPIMAGVVIGFLLLDQRDDGTLTALQVTLLSLRGYLAYRVSMPMFVSAAMSLVVVAVAGLVRMPVVQLVFVTAGAAPLAPLFALFLGSFAANKVQGFALMKAGGVLAIPPIIAYFVRSHWQLAFGLVPLYWPAKAFWAFHAGEGVAVLYVLVGLIYQFSIMALLLRRFEQIVS